MKERKGPLGRAAEGMAAVARRRQQERAPRIVLYDAAGHSRLLSGEADGYFGLLDTCGRLIALVEEAETWARADGQEPGDAGGEPAGGPSRPDDWAAGAG